MSEILGLANFQYTTYARAKTVPSTQDLAMEKRTIVSR